MNIRLAMGHIFDTLGTLTDATLPEGTQIYYLTPPYVYIELMLRAIIRVR